MKRIRLQVDDVVNDLLDSGLPYSDNFVHVSAVLHGKLEVLRDILNIDKEFFNLDKEHSEEKV